MPTGSRSTLVIWAVAGVLAALAGMRLLGGGDESPPPVAIDRPGAVEPDSTSGSRAQPTAELYVHMAGAVRRPGLMQVPEGARVAMALERAGGPTRRADLTLVNLAAQLQDGQQIVVPERVAPADAPGGAASTGAAGSTAPVHLSTATVDQLDAIDGIGPTLAARIIEFRDEHGGFRSLDQLSQVDGIGEKRLATLREALQP